MTTAIFLGAGASAAEGVPVQSGLFKEYFKSYQSYDGVYREIEQELAAFFGLFFDIDVHSDLEQIIFPTFEEVLGILDLAERRRECLKNFDQENITKRSDRLGFIRQYLILLLTKVLHEKLSAAHGLHERLIKNLLRSKLLQDTIFVTTNYDTLIDNALIKSAPGISVDYGVPFINADALDRSNKAEQVKLFKIHGSLNWLYCRTCSSLTLATGKHGFDIFPANMPGQLCWHCNALMTPIIVPPTYFKDMSNVFLSTVWNQAEMQLRKVQHIIFSGYSFPDADMHIKYLLKRIQTNRKDRLVITVLNNHQGKNAEYTSLEQQRYRRFLGHCVDYTDYSFEELSQNPEQFF